MKSGQTCVLDLGSSKVVCAAAESDSDGSVEVRALAVAECKGIKKGVVTDLDSTAKAIDVVIRKVERDLEAPVGELLVSVSGSHLEGMNAPGFVPIYPRTRSITREDVLHVINHSRQLLTPPDREQVQSLPREFRIDGQRGIQHPIGMSGAKLEVVTYMVTGQRTHLQNAERAVGMSGRKMGQFVLSSLASALAVLRPDESELGAVCVDIGAGTSDVAVFSGGSLAYSTSIPIGGALVTSDLTNLLRTSPEEAERLKRQYGAAIAQGIPEHESIDVMQIGQAQPRPLQRKVLCEIIESRVRELAGMVKTHMERSGLIGMLPGGIVLTGGGSLLPGTVSLFESVVKHVPVRLAEPDILLPEPIDADVHYSTASLSTTAGLARYAFDTFDDELAPAVPTDDWKAKVRTLWSLLGGKA